ncbi:MAG: hypothetical protein JW384_02793 [Nitrosomonadaceae bacterium]|nr:hypothetical protein [Nitrosomonadaceae bacterium]
MLDPEGGNSALDYEKAALAAIKAFSNRDVIDLAKYQLAQVYATLALAASMYEGDDEEDDDGDF